MTDLDEEVAQQRGLVLDRGREAEQGTSKIRMSRRAAGTAPAATRRARPSTMAVFRIGRTDEKQVAFRAAEEHLA
ncbi:MAG: hypothetical protein WKF78_11935 [Candidatus Limnocylindrales bacterium]